MSEPFELFDWVKCIDDTNIKPLGVIAGGVYLVAEPVRKIDDIDYVFLIDPVTLIPFSAGISIRRFVKI